MNVFRQRINALYADGVAEVKASGVEMSPADYAWLWDLSKAAIDVGRDIPEILALPVMIGKVALHPVTVGSLLWWRMAQEWFEPGAETVLAMAWMLAKAPDAEAFRMAGTRFRARCAVWWWAARLPLSATLDQLAEGVNAAMCARDGDTLNLPSAAGEKSSPRPTVADYGKFIIRLCSQQKVAPDSIRWDIPATDAYALATVDREGNVRDDSGGTEYLAYRAAIDWLKAGKAAPL